MKCVTIYRIAAAAVVLCAAMVVAEAPAAAISNCGPGTASVSDTGCAATFELHDPAGLTSADEDETRIYLDTEGQESEPDCDGDDGVCELTIYKLTLNDKDVTVHYGTSDGTATAGEDYFGVGRGTVTIPAGRRSAKARVAIRADRIMAQDEFFYLRIFDPSVGVIMNSQRRVVIPKP